jgi:hypothetical protein
MEETSGADHLQPSAVGLGTPQRAVLLASVHTAIYSNFQHPPTRRKVTAHVSLPMSFILTRHDYYTDMDF